MCPTSEENWAVIRDRKIWGVADYYKKRIQDLEVGDYLIFYVKQRREEGKIITRPRIVGIFKVSSRPFFQKEETFSSKKPRQLYPWRVTIETVAIPRKPLEFKEALPWLSFIRNKAQWGCYMQTAMRSIPGRDFIWIKSRLEQT
jgi:predicted RNA-binding protein